MALTAFQRRVCALVAQNRIAAADSYVAGGAALNELLAGARLSRDIDVFHDTDAAVVASWDAGAAAHAAASRGLVFHRGRIRGALPRIVFPS